MKNSLEGWHIRSSHAGHLQPTIDSALNKLPTKGKAFVCDVHLQSINQQTKGSRNNARTITLFSRSLAFLYSSMVPTFLPTSLNGSIVPTRVSSDPVFVQPASFSPFARISPL
ncbi:hypothetical protein TNCV_2944301 [Trichonephila clavipes]|nr:hypothetical protein TNCV_2944301 [Trichonephila clavipes]